MEAGAEAFLDAIEELEMRSLVWGFVDGSLSEREAAELARDVAGEDGVESTAAALVEKALLYAIPCDDGTVRYRSRFAETVRLLVRLRQLFPNKGWLDAPQLVSDFRVDRRSRRYPRRDLNPSEILETLRNDGLLPHAVQVEAWHALLAEMGLAGFQVRAIRRLLERTGNDGTIVTAGTGSGKTLAYYLPALLRMLPRVDASHWIKTLALYPRNELLKDQFAEAYGLARKLDAPLRAGGKRSLSIGALFGNTPRTNVDASDKGKWTAHPQRRSDLVCPFMPCPVPGCGAPLVWTNADRLVARRERLECAAPDCGMEISGEHVRLTRESLLERPPDLLFTTLEMLNQRLSDTRMRRLFGVGVPPAKRPLNVLLDEVHTYGGTTGAQGALALRRYRHLLGRDIPFAGLSATLAEAAQFFADLVGMPSGLVAEITPERSEIEEERAEYQIILRGDPSAQVALLSTSIQTVMLLARAMDPAGAGRSEGAFGERLFVFTDALDVTNRLFDDLRDAEALTIFGRRDPARSPLAVLRGESTDASAKDVYGQRWRLCEDIGRTLAEPLKVDRTSSQDAGVDAAADVIVATASLEVGYNDPNVGAILQHKAPHSAASFLQRKGRAGRSRSMRPYTVTVLSDYGRDRIAFQTFEHLFDPGISVQHLATKNEYVLRIHAVLSLFDWLAARLAGAGNIWMWDLLSRPTGGNSAGLRGARDTLEALVRGDGAVLDDLRQWLGGALQVDAATVEAIFWTAPRPLLLEAVPTLLRRLNRDWRLAGAGGGTDIQVNWHPLPDFVPRMLFGELNLPEVTVLLPPATVRATERRESLPIAKALKELAPGRVTRRFAPERGGLSHWVPIDTANDVYELPVATYCELFEPLGTFGTTDAIEVFRPWRIRVAKKPPDVQTGSNAFLEWRTQLVPQGDPLDVEVPARSAWRAYVENIRFHLHRFGASVLVRRFAPAADADVRRQSGNRSVRVRFSGPNGTAAALGFEFEADGFYVDVALPPAESVAPPALPPDVRAACRVAYFRDRVLNDIQLPGDANRFHRDWLCQIIVSAAIVRASSQGESIGLAAAAVAQDADALQRAMDVIFAIQDPVTVDEQEAEEDHDDGDDEPDAVASSAPKPRMSRLKRALTELVDREPVRARLAAAGLELDEPDPIAWVTWLRETVLETLGEAVQQACAATAPRHTATDTLVLDLEYAPDGPSRIWITESTLGGAGVVQAFADAFSEEPRALFRAVEAAVAPTDLELAADGMERYLAIAAEHPEVVEAADALRAALGHEERERLRRELWRRLAERGLDVPRALAVSLDARILRPGAARALDTTLQLVLRRWDELESQLGIAIGLREISYVASADPALADLVRELVHETAPSVRLGAVDVAQAVSGLLWPRGVEVRRRNLESYNPYRPSRLTDPALVRFLLVDERVPEILVTEPNWREALSRALEAQGTARLSCDADAAAVLRHAQVEMLTTPITVGYLRLFASVERVERNGRRLVATLSLRECV